MKSKVVGCLSIAFLLGLMGTCPAQEIAQPAPVKHAAAHPRTNSASPVKLIDAIFVPGNSLWFDISWVDQATARYYLGEAGNFSEEELQLPLV